MGKPPRPAPDEPLSAYARAPPGQAGGLIRLSGRTPNRGTQSIILSPGQRPSPADPGKAGCPPSSHPRPPRLVTPDRKATTPPANTRTNPQALPAPPAGHDPLPGRPRQGRPAGAGYAGRAPARSLTRLPARRTRQLSGGREQIQVRPKQGPPAPYNPPLNHLHCRPIQVRRVGALSPDTFDVTQCDRCLAVPHLDRGRRAGAPAADLKVIVAQGAVDAAIRRLSPAARIPA